MPLTVKVIPASPGDSILISYDYNNETKNILIDGGIGETYYLYLSDLLQKIKKNDQKINLLVITHVDYDHIEGIIRIFEDSLLDKSIIECVWFNSGETLKQYFNIANKADVSIPIENTISAKQSISQGITLEKQLKNCGCWYDELIYAPKIIENIPGVTFTILSPDINGLSLLSRKWEFEKEKSTKMSFQTDYDSNIDELLKNVFLEDRSIPNRSSIAFLLEYGSSKLLLLSDSWPSVIVNTLENLGYSKNNKLNVNVVKVSHHGSKKNTNEELLDIINCSNYIISSDASSHGLPNKECIAKIINSNQNVTIYSNYKYIDRKGIFSDDDKKKYEFKYIEMKENTPYSINGEVTLWI